MLPTDLPANDALLEATFQGAPTLRTGALNSSTFKGRCYAFVLKNCRRVADCIILLVKVIFAIIALPLILIIGAIGLIGGAIKLASLKFKTKKQPVILDKTREVKAKEHAAKFETMRAVITAPGFQKEFEEMRISRPDNDPEIQLIQKFLMFFERSQDKNRYPQYNKEFIVLLREELDGQYYQNFIKQQPKSLDYIAPPLGIKILQDFSLNIFLGVRAMSYYQELGQTIFTEVQNKSNSPPIGTTQEFAPLLQRSLSVVKSTMHTDSGFFGKSAYAMTHRKQAVASLASMGGGKKITRVLGKNGQVYDTHKEIANNPSIQGTTLWKGIQDNLVRVDNVFCASPTIGDTTIYHELLCVLDTISTNNRLPAEERNPNIPNRLLYTNFQNLAAKTGEGARSVLIMSLAEKYPGTFIGITLAKDSDFYLGKNNSWDGLETITEFGQQMQQHMLLDIYKGLNNRMKGKGNEGQGFYFPVGGSIQWENVLPAIIASATELFQTKETLQMSAVEKKELRMAYQEFVYSLIQDYLEFGEATKNPDISFMMTITACKEHADRAAMESFKKLYLRWVSQEQLEANRDECISLVFAGIHARALETRERVVIEHRTEAVLAFIKHITPAEYNEVRKTLNEQVSATFTPALTQAL